MHVVAANAAEDARGPLNNILSLSRMLKCEQPSTEEAGSIATLLEDTAARSLQKLDHQSQDAVSATIEPSDSVDFGQLCREFAALADPHARLKFGFPECAFDVDEAIVRHILNSLVDQVALHTATFLNINILPSPIDADTLRLIFEFDTLPRSRMNLVQLGTMCQMHGVRIRHVIHNEIHRVEFVLPIARPELKTFSVRGSELFQASA